MEHINPGRRRLPVVVIIGTIGSQQAHLRQRLQKIADLRFVDVDRDGNKLPTVADLFVVWVRFIRHGHYDHAKKFAPPGGFVAIAGGLKEMTDAIRANISRRFPQQDARQYARPSAEKLCQKV